MAIRGIDMQIMATKAQELSADRARADKQHEVLGQQAALRGREQVERDQQRTGKTTKVEDAKIRAEIEGHSGDGAYASERGEQDESEARQPAPGQGLLDLPVERGERTRQKNYTFDLTV